MTIEFNSTQSLDKPNFKNNPHPSQTWQGRFVRYFSKHECADSSLSVLSKLFIFTLMGLTGFFMTNLFFDPATTPDSKTKNMGIIILSAASCLVIASVATEILRCTKCLKMQSLMPSPGLMIGAVLAFGEIALDSLTQEAWQMQTNYSTNQTAIQNALYGLNFTCRQTFHFGADNLNAPGCLDCSENSWSLSPTTTNIETPTQLRVVPVENETICHNIITTTLDGLPSSFNISSNHSSFPILWPCNVPQWKVITTVPADGLNALHEALARKNLHPPAVLFFTQTTSNDGEQCWSMSGFATNFFKPRKQCARNSTWLPNPETYNPCLSAYALQILDNLEKQAAILEKTALPYPKKAVDLTNATWPDPMVAITFLAITLGLLHEGISNYTSRMHFWRKERESLLVNQT